MFKIIKLLFLILILAFENISAIHHHKRISQNFLIDTPYFWNNRIIMLNLNDVEYEKIKENFMKNKCEIINRKLKIFVRKNNSFIDMNDTKNIFFLDFKFKFKVTLIGIDGEIKYQSNDLEPFEKYFTIIDNMPIRQIEMKDDPSCN